MIRTIIVDDEPLARDGLRVRLGEERDVEIVGEAASGAAAVQLITQQRPALAFLDVRLPDFDGLEVLRRVAATCLPASVILISGHDEYAARAFDAHALDYLLKPFSAKRLQQTLSRVRLERAKNAALALTHQKLVARLPPNAPDLLKELQTEDEGANVDRLAVRDRDRIVILRPDEVDWIEAAANYAELHAGGRVFLIRTTMNELEVRLNPRLFVRVHRTTIVNVNRICEIASSEHGDYVIVLKDRTTVRLSRTHRDRVLSRMYPYPRSDSPVITYPSRLPLPASP